MRSGEWTESMALVLASGVEALVAVGLRQGEEPSAVEILKRLRGFKLKDGAALGEDCHEDTWQLAFGPSRHHTFGPMVDVSLSSLWCEGHAPHGHRWRSRTVVVTQPNDTRPGEYCWTYGGEIREPLEFRDFEHWSADDYN